MRSKYILIVSLLAIDILIISVGCFISIFSYISHSNFVVLGGQLPGYIFGFAAVFLGVRYLLALRKLWKKITEPGIVFSWNNFKLNELNTKKIGLKKY